MNHKTDIQRDIGTNSTVDRLSCSCGWVEKAHHSDSIKLALRHIRESGCVGEVLDRYTEEDKD